MSWRRCLARRVSRLGRAVAERTCWTERYDVFTVTSGDLTDDFYQYVTMYLGQLAFYLCKPYIRHRLSSCGLQSGICCCRPSCLELTERWSLQIFPFHFQFILLLSFHFHVRYYKSLLSCGHQHFCWNCFPYYIAGSFDVKLRASEWDVSLGTSCIASRGW